MQRLNVIDLDHTLLSIDSFRSFIVRHGGIGAIGPVVRRLLKLTDKTGFAREMRNVLQGKLRDAAVVERFTYHLRTKIDQAVMDRVRAETALDDMTVILSASPGEYVSRFAALLRFSAGIGSHDRDNAFFHCQGTNKIAHVRQAFPQDTYEYHFSISDSLDDLELLRLFRVGILITKKGRFQDVSDRRRDDPATAAEAGLGGGV